MNCVMRKLKNIEKHNKYIMIFLPSRKKVIKHSYPVGLSEDLGKIPELLRTTRSRQPGILLSFKEDPWLCVPISRLVCLLRFAVFIVWVNYN